MGQAALFRPAVPGPRVAAVELPAPSSCPGLCFRSQGTAESWEEAKSGLLEERDAPAGAPPQALQPALPALPTSVILGGAGAWGGHAAPQTHRLPCGKRPLRQPASEPYFIQGHTEAQSDMLA